MRQQFRNLTRPLRRQTSQNVLQIYNNQLALEAAIMERTLLVEQQGHTEAGENVRGALHAIGENAHPARAGQAAAASW